MIPTFNDGDDGLVVRSIINQLVAAANAGGGTTALPKHRVVRVEGDATDTAALGGTANNVYTGATAATTAYQAADTLANNLGANQIVYLVVGTTVTTNNGGQYSCNVGGIDLTAAYNKNVVILGLSPRSSVIDYIKGESSTGNAYAIEVTAINMRIGTNGSLVGISSRATGASGNSGAITARLANVIVQNGIVADITNVGNNAGNGGTIVISPIISILNSDNMGEVVIQGSVLTSAKSGGTGTAGSLQITGNTRVFGSIITANNCLGGGVSFNAFASSIFIFGGLTVNTTSTSNVTVTMTSVTCSQVCSINIPGTSFSATNCRLADLTVTNNGTGATTATITNSTMGQYISNAATVTSMNMCGATGIANLGANSTITSCAIIAGTGSPAINKLGSGCKIFNTTVSGGSLSIDNAGTAVTVVVVNSTLSVAVGNNITIVNEETPQTLVDGGVITWDLEGSTVAVVTLGGARTLSITNNRSRRFGTLIIKQDATGSRTLALPAGHKVVNNGNNTLSLTSAPNSIDAVTFIFDGTTYYWTMAPKFT